MDIHTTQWRSQIPDGWFVVDHSDGLVLANESGTTKVTIRVLTSKHPDDQQATDTFVKGAKDKHETVLGITGDHVKVVVAEHDRHLTARVINPQLAMMLEIATDHPVGDAEHDFIAHFAGHLERIDSAPA
ncbi:MAG: hypothetical protein ACOCVS_03630 [Planctomycetota bacterium]